MPGMLKAKEPRGIFKMAAIFNSSHLSFALHHGVIGDILESFASLKRL